MKEGNTEAGLPKGAERQALVRVLALLLYEEERKDEKIKEMRRLGP